MTEPTDKLPSGWTWDEKWKRWLYDGSHTTHVSRSDDKPGMFFWRNPRGDFGHAPTMLQAMCCALGIEIEPHGDTAWCYGLPDGTEALDFDSEEAAELAALEAFQARAKPAGVISNPTPRAPRVVIPSPSPTSTSEGVEIAWTTDGPIHVASSPGGLWLIVDEPPPSAGGRAAGDPCIWQVRIGSAAGPLLAHGTKRDAEQARGEAEASAEVLLRWHESLVRGY